MASPTIPSSTDNEVFTATEVRRLLALVQTPTPAPGRTLLDLLRRLHADKAADWSHAYNRAQERYRRFWLRALSPNHPLPLTPADVEKRARIAARVRSWSLRSHYACLRYIVDAAYYGQRKLKWYSEADNLSAVTFPRVQSVSRPYSVDEMTRLLAVSPAVDLRAAVALHIAYDSQRRATAILSLRADAYAVEEIKGKAYGVIQFPGHTDKARRSGRVVLTDIGRQLVEALLATPEVKASGFLFPGAKRSSERPLNRITFRTFCKLLNRVEYAAGVEHVKGRGLHGVKRRAVTDGARVASLAAVSSQSGTNAETLRRVYLQDDLPLKADLADALNAIKPARDTSEPKSPVFPACGHPYTPANSYTLKKGAPYCKTCHLDRCKNYKQQRKACG